MAVPTLHEQVRRAVEERAALEARDGRFHVILGLPFALFGWVFLTGMIWLPLFLFWSMLPWSVFTSFWIALASSTAAIVHDCIRHPIEEWKRARYFQAGGSYDDGDGAWIYGRGYGAFDGMPPMTAISDPGNLAVRGGVIANGFANVILAGPRGLRTGLAKLALARRYRDPRLVDAAAAFVDWVAATKDATARDAEAVVRANPSWSRGAALALDLGQVRVTRVPGLEPTLRLPGRVG